MILRAESTPALQEHTWSIVLFLQINFVQKLKKWKKKERKKRKWRIYIESKKACSLSGQHYLNHVLSILATTSYCRYIYWSIDQLMRCMSLWDMSWWHLWSASKGNRVQQLAVKGKSTERWPCPLSEFSRFSVYKMRQGWCNNAGYWFC